MIKKILKSRLFIPLLLLAAVGGFFGVNAYNYYRFPAITGIEPSVAYPGELISIYGSFFGNSRNGAEVRIAGGRPLSHSYQNWSDNLIIVQVPSDVGSGMVTVETRRGLSNGVLFTNREHIPIILSGPQKPGYPYLEAAEPESGSVGAMVTISGLNFSHERGNAAVFFTAAGVSDDNLIGDDALSGMIECSEIDYDYESWDEQQIQVFIPDGASSGNIRIQTDRGISNALYFEVTGSAGTKTFFDKMGFQVEYGIDISGVDGDVSNGLDLWVPAVRFGLEQRNVETVTEPVPLWNDYMGIMRYHLDNLNRDQTYSVSIKSWLERYNVETRIVIPKVKSWYNEDRRLYKVYTAPEEQIPSDDQVIIDNAAAAVRRESNPYLKASAIYKYLLKKMKYMNRVSSSSVVKSLEAGEGDSYTYSILFTALCRASGIPARPATGVLVYNNKQATNHYWAEFYIDAFGWIPVDPALGDGARFGNFPIDEDLDPVEYYFGNLDNHHINLTRGIVPVKQIAPDGRISGRKGNYSLQTIYEESIGIKSYSSYWRAVRIVDWW
ncbi:MAG: IPT/TIG domain-containing protein [Spirochaetales bacterium]|nr:IPT/TIG domain-containing protein [Spirochaetales bacterium]